MAQVKTAVSKVGGLTEGDHYAGLGTKNMAQVKTTASKVAGFTEGDHNAGLDTRKHCTRKDSSKQS